MQLFQLGVWWYIPAWEREISLGADSGLLAVDGQPVLMGTDDLVTGLQTPGPYCGWHSCSKTDGLVHSEEPGGDQSWTQISQTLHTASLHVGARSSCQLSLHPPEWTHHLPSQAGGDPRTSSPSGVPLRPQGKIHPQFAGCPTCFPWGRAEGQEGGLSCMPSWHGERRRGASSPC